MKLQFGVELECFYLDQFGEVCVPPAHLPTDGFAGLVEFRTIGGQSLAAAMGDISTQIMQTQEACRLAHHIDRHTFSGHELAVIRRRANVPAKSFDEIENIYGLAPKNLKGAAIASFQVSFSQPGGSHYTRNTPDARLVQGYDVFDFVPYIRRLDKEFKAEISASGRQPGFYAVKGDRVEYRSLPSSVYKYHTEAIDALYQRLNRVFAAKEA